MSRPALSIACKSGSPSRASIGLASTVTWTSLGALVNFASTAMKIETVPLLASALVLNSILQFYKSIKDGLRPRWTSGNIQMNRNDAIDSLQHRVIVIRTTRAGAGTERNHPFRFGHLLVNAAQD